MFHAGKTSFQALVLIDVTWQDGLGWADIKADSAVLTGIGQHYLGIPVIVPLERGIGNQIAKTDFATKITNQIAAVFPNHPPAAVGQGLGELEIRSGIPTIFLTR